MLTHNLIFQGVDEASQPRAFTFMASQYQSGTGPAPNDVYQLLPFATAPVWAKRSADTGGFVPYPLQTYPADLLAATAGTTIYNSYRQMACYGSSINIRVEQLYVYDEERDDLVVPDDMDLTQLRIMVLPYDTVLPPYEDYPDNYEQVAHLQIHPLVNWSPRSNDPNYFPHVFATTDHRKFYALGARMGDPTYGASLTNPVIDIARCDNTLPFGARYVSPLLNDRPLFWHVGVVWPIKLPEEYNAGSYFAVQLSIETSYDCCLFDPPTEALYPLVIASPDQVSRDIIRRSSAVPTIRESLVAPEDDIHGDESLIDVDMATPVGTPVARTAAAITVADTKSKRVGAKRNWALDTVSSSPRANKK